MKNVLSNNLGELKKTSFNIVKVLVITYFLTVVLLIVLAFMMYKVDLQDDKINLGIIIIMILSTFIGGLISGKIFKHKKWMYGLIVGVAYFVILAMVSSIINTDGQLSRDLFTMFLMCSGGGTLGGMMS